ncbi:MAG: O-antigen ligase family protein [Chloroflexi bacterium]|nr:O-antigen ligase family protein [Chloroflexota bacterium]
MELAPGAARALLRPLARAAVFALAAGLAVIALQRPHPLIAIAPLAIGGFLLALARPAWLVPLIIATLPLEVSKIFIPFLRAPTPWAGYEMSLLDVSRIVTLLAIAVWGLQGLARGSLAVPRNPLTALAFLLLALGLLSMAWTPDPGRGAVENLRLTFNVLTFLAVGHFVRTRERLDGAVAALVASGAAVALFAIVQGATGVGVWVTQLAGASLRRANSTFADPNSLAMYLNLVLAMCLVSLRAVRHPLARLGLYAAMALSLGGLVLSFSRAGWVVGLLVLGLYAVLRAVRQPRAALALVLMAGGVAALGLALVPEVGERLEQFSEPAALSVRPYLIDAGLLMFREHPLVGIGLGAYRYAATHEYAFANPYVWYVSASHTALVTTAAELGLAGLTLTAAFCWTAARQLWPLLWHAPRARDRAYATGLLLGLLALLVAGQSIGIFFEDPYLWILLALLVALRRQVRAGEADRAYLPAR